MGKCFSIVKHLSLNHDQAHKISGLIGGAKVNKTHVSTWRMLFKYFNCLRTIILSIFIIVIFIGCPILNCMILYKIMMKANIAQFCGPVEIIVGDWIW